MSYGNATYDKKYPDYFKHNIPSMNYDTKNNTSSDTTNHNKNDVRNGFDSNKCYFADDHDCDNTDYSFRKAQHVLPR